MKKTRADKAIDKILSLEIEQGIKRVPRPMGLTLQCKAYTKDPTQENKRKIQQILIATYLQNNLLGINQLDSDRRLSIPELAEHIGMEQEELEKELNERLKGRNSLFDNKETSTYYTRELLFGLFQKITANHNLAHQQADIMLRAQNGAYKPFISGEVNRAIANSTASLGPLLQLVSKQLDIDSRAREADQRLNINILNQAETRQYITVNEASELLEKSPSHVSVLTQPELILEEGTLPDLPEVKARFQDLNSIGIRHDGLTLKAQEQGKD